MNCILQGRHSHYPEYLDFRSPIGVEDKLRGNDESGLVTFYEFVML